jgi:hypothetical protein
LVLEVLSYAKVWAEDYSNSAGVWYRQNNLFNGVLVMEFLCRIPNWYFLVFENDGTFYYECWDMFFTGVEWYKPLMPIAT